MGTDFRTKPILLQIEPTNHCNLKCVICPNEKMVRERGYLDLALFKKIVDQTIDTAWEYSFAIGGEPTMHPDLIEMIQYIKRKGGRAALYTNMNYRDSNLSHSFIKVGLDRIVVNMCTVEANTYKTITQTGDYHLFIRNLTKLREAKKKLKKEKPIIVGSFLKTTVNNRELDEEKKNFRKYFDYCMVLEIHDWAGDQNIAALNPAKEKSCIKKRCSNLRTSAVVLWDGRVAACCYDYEGKVIFGNLNQTTVYDIWNSPEIRNFRKKHRNSSFCKGCQENMRSQFSIKNIYDYFRINLQ